MNEDPQLDPPAAVAAVAAPIAPKPPVWPVFVTFGAVVVTANIAGVSVLLGAALVLGENLVDTLVHPTGPASLFARPGVLLISMVGTQLIIGAAVVVAARLDRQPFAERLRLRPAPREALVILVGLAALLGTSQTVASLLEYAGVGGESVLMLVRRVSQEAPTGMFLALLAVGSLAPGLLEELLFRGYIQTRTVQRWGRWPGILVASALFGVMHADYLHAPLAFGIGVILGWITEATGSIRPAIAIHVLNNFTSFVGERLGWFSPADPKDHLVMAGGSLVVGLLGWIALTAVVPRAQPVVAALPGDGDLADPARPQQ